jgi:crotonobetainyl-CoA:carnitine CoA-transferase CaiB-like acyl-CoA transferase
MMSETVGERYFLGGIRVVELADELGEYCGKLLGGLGADVIKVEPLGGEGTRGYGPFYQDQPHPDRSLYFWHYNLGKRSITLDLDDEGDRDAFRRLIAKADVLIDTRPRGWLDERGLGFEELRKLRPGLIHARISPFGDDGPWADYRGSDLVHLALGGMMMNSGYDAEPDGTYRTPPIAPQMWHAYHIAGELAAFQIMAALHARLESGRGQALSFAVHEAAAKNTELDMPAWVYARQPVNRQTCRHAVPQLTPERPNPELGGANIPGPSRTMDGRWVLAHRSFLPGFYTPLKAITDLMDSKGFHHDLDDPKYEDQQVLLQPEVALHVTEVVDRFLAKFAYDRDLWKEGQDAGLPWAPLRLPEENLDDEHWAARNTFATVEYPELGKSFRQVGPKWAADGADWKIGPRAPLIGEHSAQIRASLPPLPQAQALPQIAPAPAPRPASALKGLRVIDLSWLVASGGAGRFLAAHGAEVIKVEHASRMDGMRMGGCFVGPGGRAARDAATAPLAFMPDGSLNRSGAFMEINAAKRSFTLNLREQAAKDILTDLLKDADMVIEGFSPGTMDKMGFGWKRLQEINPRIVYVQQSGMGQIGTYGRLRSFGPSAAAFSGLSEMSGLPDPWPPAGIGYSYLDWFGAYQMANAMIAAAYRQRVTGKGCWIDSSQVECGLFLTGTAILDASANGRRWRRYGNHSPWKPAAPHGAYRAEGTDRWVAIAAFTEGEWHALARVLGHTEWTCDARFATLALRIQNQDALDALVNAATQGWERYALMEALQAAGVPAGVCQTAQDRCEVDPQLAHLAWMVELEQSEIGRWPVREVPGRLSETPSYIGGPLDRHGPSYGEDNRYVLEEILKLGDEEIARLEAGGVF